MRLVLRASPCADEPLTPVGQPPQRPGSLIRSPHWIKHPRHREPRQRPSVEPIGLRLRVTDRFQLARVRDDHPDPVTLEHRDDPIATRRRLDHDHVICKQTLRHHLQGVDPR